MQGKGCWGLRRVHTNSANLPVGWVRVPGKKVATRLDSQDLGIGARLGTLGSRLKVVSSTNRKTRRMAAPTGPRVHQKTYSHGLDSAINPPRVPPPTTAKMISTSKIAKALPRWCRKNMSMMYPVPMMAGMTPNKPQMRREMVNGMKSSGPVMFAAQIWHAKVPTRLQRMTELRPTRPANGVNKNGPAIHPASAAATVLSRSACVFPYVGIWRTKVSWLEFGDIWPANPARQMHAKMMIFFRIGQFCVRVQYTHSQCFTRAGDWKSASWVSVSHLPAGHPHRRLAAG